MRAVAVLVVCLNHLFNWPAGGFVGVDIFFVLSGFFITSLLIRERSTTKRLSFADFYARRAKRILPSALLVLTTTVISSYILLPAVRAKQTLLDGLYAAIFASNFRFEAVAADYFQRSRPPSPLLHYWSLSIEEQFYFVWPALLALIFALIRGLQHRGKVQSRDQNGMAQWGLFTLMTVLATASFLWAMFLSAYDPNRAYFSSFGRLWELGVGGLLAISGPWLAKIPSAIRPVMAYLGLTGVIASLFLINPTVMFPAPWAALPVVSTAIVVASFHGAEVRGMLPLTNPIARWFGDTSYTLYLWHWPVITLLLTIVPKGPFFYCTAVTVALVLTAITYRFYENPIRKSNWLFDQEEPQVPKQGKFGARIPRTSRFSWTVVGGLLATVVLLSISGVHYEDKLLEASEESRTAEKNETLSSMVSLTPNAPQPLAITDSVIEPLTTPLPGNDQCFGAPAILNKMCQLWNPDVKLEPSLENFADDWKPPSCWTSKQQELKSCTSGYSGDDTTRIALVGDSHAARVLVALTPYLTANKWQLTTYLGDECNWQDLPRDACKRAMAETQKELLAQPYDLVITTGARWSGDPAGYARAWRTVAAAGSRIAVIADNPRITEDAIACLTRIGLSGGTTGQCDTPEAEALTPPDPLLIAAPRVAETTVIDLTQYYCKNGLCPSVIGNVTVYADKDSHLTDTFVRTLAPALIDGVQRTLAPRR